MNTTHARSFASDLIRGSAGRAAHRDSVLADGCTLCPYPAVEECIEVIQGYLAGAGAAFEDCLTVEVANCVTCALTLLAIVDYGWSLAMLPSARTDRERGMQPRAPAFSRWIVGVLDGAASTGIDLRRPGTFLQVRPNPAYREDAAVRAERRSKLYLRTSGSLGTPKLVMHDYMGFVRNSSNGVTPFDFDPSTRLALPIPLLHAYGLGIGFLGSFSRGASISLIERANLVRYLEREAAFQPNTAFMTPSFCEILASGRRGKRLYKFTLTGGDRTAPATFRRYEDMHGPLINGYGCTEFGFISCGNLGLSSEMRSRTVGWPVPETEVRTAKAEEAQEDSGSLGLVEVRSQTAFEAYVDFEGNCIARHGADDWHRTGDLGRIGADGTLEVIGRADLSVNRQGRLLAFAEVEGLITEIEGVSLAAVAAGAETAHGRVLVGFCELQEGTSRSAEHIRSDCAKRMPPFALPDRIVVLEALPKLANGKIDRRDLAHRAMALTTPLAS